MCHHVGLQPDAQSIGVTKAQHITHTGNTHQARFDIDINVVRHEVLVIFTVGTLYGKDLQNVVLTFFHLYADLSDIGGQQCLSTGYTVLHVHRCHVWVGALLEVDVNLYVTV